MRFVPKLPKLPKLGRPRLRRGRKEDSGVPGWSGYVPRKVNPDHVDIDKLRKQRKRNQMMSKLKPGMPEMEVGFRPRINPVILVVIVFIAAISGFAYYLYDQEVFIVTEVLIEGNQEISDLQIVSTIGDLKGESLLEIQGFELEYLLESSFPYIRRVYVKKMLPGKIEILVEERFPELVYMNLSGAFLIDRDQIVVEALGVDQTRELSEEERLILDGYGDLEADYVFRHYTRDVESQDEIEQINWEEVPEAEKRQALEQIRNELLVQVLSLHDEKLSYVVNALYQSLPHVYGFDSDVYEIGGSFPIEIVEYSKTIREFFLEEGIAVNKLTWRSAFTLEVNVLSNIQILFSRFRELDDQLIALQTVRTNTDIRGVRLIDLRSEVVAVK